MKASKIFIILSLAAGLVSLPIIHSCDPSHLDLKPGTETEAMMFQSEEDFIGAIIGVYAKLTDFYYFHANNPTHPMWLLPGDDATTAGTSPFESFSGMQPGQGLLGQYWTAAYQLINRANVVLQKIAEENGVIKKPGLKDNIKGEALFLRGWAFFGLYNFFGTAPVITERISSLKDIYPASSTGTQLLDQAIADFQEAAELLPVSYPENQIGRITKDAANGMLGKTLVFRACYKKNTADYTAAISAFNKITTRQLVADFGANFDAYNENNEESLFEFQASNAPSFENIWLWNDFDIAIGPMSSYWGFFYGAWSWWNLDNMCIVPSKKLLMKFEQGDPRVIETLDTIAPDNGNAYRYPPMVFGSDTIKVAFAKYVKRGKEGDVTSSVDNPRILRYADVLLLKAEAILKSGGSKADAIALVNQIRERARNSASPASAVPADHPLSETDENTIMQWIMDERFLELCAEEGIRWLDLKRWHAAGYINLANWTASDNYFSSVRIDFKFGDWYNQTNGQMLFPIPTSEVNANPSIKQNTGY